MRCAYLAEITYRPILRPGRKGEYVIFRPQAVQRDIFDKTVLDLRFQDVVNFTLKQNTLTRADLDKFVVCYHPENRFEHQETWSPENPEGRWRAYNYEELISRDKVILDILWLRDESLEDSASLPEPDVLAAEIIEDLETALLQFRNLYDAL